MSKLPTMLPFQRISQTFPLQKQLAKLKGNWRKKAYLNIQMIFFLVLVMTLEQVDFLLFLIFIFIAQLLRRGSLGELFLTLKKNVLWCLGLFQYNLVGCGGGRNEWDYRWNKTGHESVIVKDRQWVNGVHWTCLLLCFIFSIIKSKNKKDCIYWFDWIHFNLS